VIWRAAGVCGVHPGPYTFGQLSAMLEQRERSEWARTSSIMWVIASSFAPKGKKLTPASFDPWAKQSARTVGAVEFGHLLGLSSKGKP